VPCQCILPRLVGFDQISGKAKIADIIKAGVGFLFASGSCVRRTVRAADETLALVPDYSELNGREAGVSFRLWTVAGNGDVRLSNGRMLKKWCELVAQYSAGLKMSSSVPPRGVGLSRRREEMSLCCMTVSERDVDAERWAAMRMLLHENGRHGMEPTKVLWRWWAAA